MKKQASLGIIFITIFIDLMGFGLVIPVIPTYANKILGIPEAGIGLIIAAYSIMQFLFNPIAGKFSDKIGRRPIILYSLLISVFAYILFSIADSFILLLLSRMMAGLGGSNIGAAQAYIADITTKEERTKGMALIGTAFGLGFVFGPVLGGYLSGFGYFYVGFSSALASFIALIFAFFFLPESLTQKTENNNTKIFDFKGYSTVLREKITGRLIMIFFVSVFSVANIYGTYAIFTSKELNFSDSEIGLLYGVMGITSIIIQGFLLRIMVKYISEKKLFNISIIFLTVGLFFIPVGLSFTQQIIILAVMSIGTAVGQPLAMSMISRYTSPEKQGTVLGINQSMASLGRVLGPLWGGFTYQFFGHSSPFITGAFFTFLIFIYTIFFFRKL